MQCAICRIELNTNNLSTKEDGTPNLDSSGKPWCKKCQDEYDSIDWQELIERRMDNAD